MKDDSLRADDGGRLMFEATMKRNVAGVEVVDLLSEAVERLPTDPKGRDTRRQNMRQALEGMIVDGTVFKHGSTVSSTSVVVSEGWLDV